MRRLGILVSIAEGEMMFQTGLYFSGKCAGNGDFMAEEEQNGQNSFLVEKIK